MVVFAGDMNGHVGSSNAGYDATHGGFVYGSRNADGSRILEFVDYLVIYLVWPHQDEMDLSVR